MSTTRVAEELPGVSLVMPAYNEAAGIAGGETLGGVIRLFRPARLVLLDELEPAAIDDVEAIGAANDDQRGPAGVRLEAEGDLHRESIAIRATLRPLECGRAPTRTGCAPE